MTTSSETRAALLALLEEELEGLGPFGEVVLRVQVRDGRLHRAEASRVRSVMLGTPENGVGRPQFSGGSAKGGSE